MLLHTKFCPIFIIVTLIEARGEQQGGVKESSKANT